MKDIKQFILQHKTASVVMAVALLLFLVVLRRGSQFKHVLPIVETTVVYIPTGSSFQDLTDTLVANGCIDNVHAFKNVAKTRKLDRRVRSGRYELQPGMTLLKMVNKLRSGNQDAVRLTINKHRTKEQFCTFLSTRLEFSSDTMLTLLNDAEVAQQYGFTPETFLCMFVQNTYDIYWNCTPTQFLDRMKKEYDRFWNGMRRGQCSDLGLSQQQVITLASIVEEETNQDHERAKIASVYLNRLRRDMPLQADPTVKYAVGDFSLRRILGKHLEKESPYNTYKYKGLPPGPICMPSIKSIDAVLSNLHTNYLFFCAKEDFSGSHNFAATSAEHMQNAQRFHQAMNQRGIK